jgi:hypothetical protein
MKLKSISAVLEMSDQLSIVRLGHEPSLPLHPYREVIAFIEAVLVKVERI